MGKVNRLSAAKVKKITEPGLHGDGGTLYLAVAPGGSKSWIQRLTIDGKRRDVGLGGWPLVSLAEAREAAFANRKLARAGGDPLAEKRRSKVPTFREAAEKTFEANRPRWRNAKVEKNWMQQLQRYALPALGDMRIDRIGREHVLRVLTPIWAAKPETGRKVRQRIRAIMGLGSGARLQSSTTWPETPSPARCLPCLRSRSISAPCPMRKSARRSKRSKRPPRPCPRSWPSASRC